jgi:hypothetical protein
MRIGVAGPQVPAALDRGFGQGAAAGFLDGRLRNTGRPPRAKKPR